MKRKITFILIMALIPFFVLIARPPTSHGNVMTFNSPTSSVLATQNYIEDGIIMSSLGGHYDFFDNGMVQTDTYHPSFDSSNGKYFTSLKFEMEDKSLFNLNSLYVYADGLLNSGGPFFDEVSYIFSFSNGLNISFINPTNNIDIIRTFSDFTNLSYFTYSIIVNNKVEQYNSRLDNIDMTPVPEPSTLLLLWIGVVSLVLYGRSGIRSIPQIECKGQG